jgi:23S rRNA (guanosine2251-2'-O)-methyltransferase
MIKTLYLAKDIDKKEFSRLSKMDFELKRIPPQAAQKLSKGASHQGFLAEVEDIELKNYRDMLDDEFLLVLSGLTDVGNIGSLVRSAYALGIDGIIVTGVKNLPLDSIARISTGALFDIPFSIERNIYDVLNDLKTSGFKLYGADMDAKDVKEVSFKGKKVLILGSEDKGFSKKVASRLDEIISIKMDRKFDSLNVSVAGAILMDRMRDE